MRLHNLLKFVLLIIILSNWDGAFAGVIVSGKVTDKNGTSIVAAKVSLYQEPDMPIPFTGTTDGSGNYQIDITEWTGIEAEEKNETAVNDFALLQNYPNPFNPSTTIPYYLKKRAQVQIDIFNVLGQLVRTLVNEYQPAGHKQIGWDGRDDLGRALAAGVYFYRMQVDGLIRTRKLAKIDGTTGGRSSVQRRPAFVTKAASVQTTHIFTASVIGNDIIDFVQPEISVSGNMQLDFVVRKTDDIVTHKDVEYSSYEFNGSTHKLLLDLTLPGEDALQPYPLIIFMHGGGWVEGNKEEVPCDVFTQWGYAVANINYRLAPDAIFPAMLYDAKAAVRWLRANAATYHLDTNRVAAMGVSSGGQLAALLGTTGNVPELEGDGGNLQVSSNVQAVCDLFGPTDFTKVQAAIPDTVPYPFPPDIAQKYGNNPFFYYEYVACLALGGRVFDHLELAAQANPITHVDAQDPPFLIIHGELDTMVPINQSEILADALLANGVDVMFDVEPTMGHGQNGPAGEVFHPRLLGVIIPFLENHLK